ncbi:Netrin receptor unc5c [Desmophyllum pertusum]|uniref:Netrin receptor unc5c n=1 Tax=Desmophyllum pertusum TaxID=174260 RepID=A0A9W9ZJ95_9CNID|nr:Netrin receptor unc5c [Desmophyllum pertusum]
MDPEPASDEDHQSSIHQVSGGYKVSSTTSSPATPIVIEHCCLRAPGNKWNIAIKCRTPPKKSQNTSIWIDVIELYPNAKIEDKHNDIEVTLPPLQEGLEIAAFGTPGKDDQKRMQMAIFGRNPTQGRNWKIRVYLIDDSTIAFKNVCQKEEEMGNRLLTALAGLFVSNSDEDIRIKLTDLEPGWQIKGCTVKTIKSKNAWQSPENATDFPRCHFEIIHVDKTKQSFFCGMTASHENDQANTEVVAYFERVSYNDHKGLLI